MRLEPKPIPGYEDNYYLDPERMCVVNKKTGHVLKPCYDRCGYANVSLWKNNKGTHKNLHRLFAEAYIPNPDNLPCVNHKDENPMNYNLDNLEWCTQSYNQRYGTVNERRPWIAEQRGIPVVAIDPWGNETEYPSAREAARQLDLDQSSITAVLRGRRKTVGNFRFEYA